MEIGKVRLERDRLVAENIRHQQQIDGLHKKLEVLSDGLSAEDKRMLAAMPKQQREENELLRSMVLKQLRRQAQLKQAKELVLRQLDSVGARSSALMEVVEDMARGPQLSREERALFRSPQFSELIEEVSPAEGNGGATNIVYDSLYAPSMGTKKVKVDLHQVAKAARLDFMEGRYAEAEAGFLKFLHYRPQDVHCLCNLGTLKMTLKNYSEARQYLQKAVAIDRSSGRAYYLLGRSFFLEENFDEALPHFVQGIKLEPKNPLAHNCIGIIAGQKGWIERAERAFTNAVTLKPDFGNAHFNLAVLFSTAARPDARRAGEHYFKALDLNIPRDASIEDFLKRAAQQMNTTTAQPIEVGMRGE